MLYLEYNVRVHTNGMIEWFDKKTNFLHRLDGPAVENANGTKDWYVQGDLHRVDGPAIERADGSKHWYVKGKRHRVDGPAIEYADGSRCWYLEGKKYSLSDYNAKLRSRNSAPCEGKVVEIDGKKYKLTEVR